MKPLSLAETIERFRLGREAALLVHEEICADATLTEATFGFWFRCLSTWDQPAESRFDALKALEFAIEEEKEGDTPVVASMMKAALGYLVSVDARDMAGENTGISHLHQKSAAEKTIQGSYGARSLVRLISHAAEALQHCVDDGYAVSVLADDIQNVSLLVSELLEPVHAALEQCDRIGRGEAAVTAGPD